MLFLPRPRAEVAKERSHGAALRNLPRVPRKNSPPCRHSEAGLYRLPSGPGRRLRQRRARPGSQDRQRGRAGLLPLPRQRPRTASTQVAGVPHGRPRYLRHVPQRGGRAIPGQRARPGSGPRRYAGAALHRLPRRAQDFQHGNEASPVNSAHIRDTCGSCHGDVRLTRKFGLPSDRLVSFDSSYHGLASKAGSQTVANCASCHGVHNILASSDPKSTINARNLPKTCGQCHAGAGTRFAISQVHVAEGRTEPAALRLVRQFYLLVIPVTIGLMILHNGGDWLRKLIRLRFQGGAGIQPARLRATASGHGDLRMLPFERLQHAVLAISFLTLVWTGFALKYPDTWWARPLLVLEGSHSMRSLIHRVAAAIFMAITVTHLVSLIVSRKLREHWKEMLPNINDPREGLSNFAYNLGLGDQAPGRSAHSYVEKAEYWAVVWGAVVMIASGVMLWADSLVLKLLPKAWLDVATSVHFYEAVLATLAIVVWHFYPIIFDPDVYPLNTAFLTGFSVKKSQHSVDRHATEEAKVAGD